jgi:hypothetical protein
MIKLRRITWAGHCSMHGKTRNTYKILVGKPEGKRLLQRSRHRWVDNIKMDLTDIGFGGVGWIHLSQSRDQWLVVVNTVLKLWVP